MYDLPKRFTVITYISQQETPYPINKLRNIAISFVHTSHFGSLTWTCGLRVGYIPLVSPTAELYSTLINLPASYLKEDKNVCIVPSWEYIMEPNAQCNTFQNCIERIYTLLPGTKQELRRCVEDRFCFRFRESSNTHVVPPPLSHVQNYHTDDWFDLPSDTYVRELPACSTTSRSPMCSSSARPRCRASTSDLWTTERTRCSSSRISACWATSTTCSRRASPSMSRILGENGVSK